ncbi:MAG: hypothetical protein LRY66_09460 [Saccharospirillaceae bacterium]|nr:hypothetical protein [Saccharospirillaceae bacterium]MCD8531570.1 hypothetical protein [Saccharospirillaceae bacterium]
MMKQPVLNAIVAACTLLLASHTLAFDGKHREIDWDDKLALTDTQEQSIDTIEDNYESKIRELRKADMPCTESRARAHELMQAMRTEIQQVLTPEQRGQAQILMREQHAKMQRKHAKELARKLDLSDEQKSTLLKAVKELKDDYQWPLDQTQREAARQQFQQTVHSVLSPEQQEKWAAMKEKQMRKWHHPDEDGLKSHHGQRKHQDCDH